MPAKIGALPFVLPLLGGLTGVIFVNLNQFASFNPVFGIGLGAVVGWFLARLLQKLLHGKR